MRELEEILSHWQETGSIQGTASSLGVDRRTVRRYVTIARTQGYEAKGEPPPGGWQAFVRDVLPRTAHRAAPSEAMQRIAGFHQDIVAGVAQTNAATVWQRLRDERGLRVSLTSFYRYLHQHATPETARKGITIRKDDPPPGDVAEVDFGALGFWWDPAAGRRRKLHAFIMVLAHSRHIFVWVTPVMDQRAWVQAHVEAFAFFGGVPARVILDNLKDGVMKPDIYDPQCNRTYEELARHYRCLVDPARARKPKDKPRVERMVSYVRSSFWKGRTFASLPEINAAARTWSREVAGQRVHGTTGLQPLAHFTAAEQEALRPLPREPFELAQWTTAKVGPDCHIQVGRALYSVPFHYVGKTLDVRLTDLTVQCFLDEELVKTHPRVGARQRNTDWNDYPPEKARVLRENPDWCRRRARGIGDATAWAVETLLDRHVQHHLRGARGILRLAESYGYARVEAACERARAYGDPAFRTIKGILERGLDQEAPHPQRGESTLAGAFLRGPDAWLVSGLAREGRHE